MVSRYDVYGIMEIFYGIFKLIDYIHNIFIFEKFLMYSLSILTLFDHKYFH